MSEGKPRFSVEEKEEEIGISFLVAVCPRYNEKQTREMGDW
jgi:hypothetical protein